MCYTLPIKPYINIKSSCLSINLNSLLGISLVSHPKCLELHHSGIKTNQVFKTEVEYVRNELSSSPFMQAYLQEVTSQSPWKALPRSKSSTWKHELNELDGGNGWMHGVHGKHRHNAQRSSWGSHSWWVSASLSMCGEMGMSHKPLEQQMGWVQCIGWCSKSLTHLHHFLLSQISCYSPCCVPKNTLLCLWCSCSSTVQETSDGGIC